MTQVIARLRQSFTRVYADLVKNKKARGVPQIVENALYQQYAPPSSRATLTVLRSVFQVAQLQILFS